MDSRYITSAAKPEQLPTFELPELAFIGRSNTGKSSLLNALLGRRNLARRGRTPGQTQMINFFSVNDKAILADLPGYGYNIAGHDVSKHWQPLASKYFRRPNIVKFLYLHDCRRGLQEMDQKLLFQMGRQLPVHVIFTKIDKIPQRELKKTKTKMQGELDKLGIDVADIFPTSTLKSTGIQELRASVLEPFLDLD